jgi:hypothetical protein
MVVHHSGFAAGDRAGAQPWLLRTVALDDLEGHGDQVSRWAEWRGWRGHREGLGVTAVVRYGPSH